MIDSMIRDYKREVETLYEKIEKLLVGDDYKRQLADIRIALDKSNPSLMFYGIYNAGKSSLLNAIFGVEKASVNDIPETHKVTSYDWRSYTLVDTPGLNGPIEDEKITMEEVEKHDIIMFVIDDSDNFDSDVITRKIIDILESKRPCIIVINRKNDSSDDVIMGIKSKMKKNIQHLSSVEQNYDFIDVDATTALKAKKENKPTLLDDSNIQVLEYMISERLASVDQIMMLHIPLEMMRKLCVDMIDNINGEISEVSTKRLLELQNNLGYVCVNVKNAFGNELKSKIDCFSETIYSNAVSGKNTELDKNECEKIVQELIIRYSKKFSEETKSTINQFTTNWRLEVDASSLNLDNVHVDIDKKENDVEKDSLDEILDVLEKLPIPIPTPTPIPTPIPLPMLVQAIKILKKWIFGSNDQEPNVDDINEQERQSARERELALKQLHNKITMQMDNFFKVVKGTFDNEIDKAYTQENDELESVIAKKEGHKAELIKELEVLNEVVYGIDEMKRIITKMI